MKIINGKNKKHLEDLILRYKKIKPLKFPKEKITTKTKQEELPTVREIVEKINEIIDIINNK